MSEGPQGILFLTVEDYLLKVSPEGKLLNRMHLKNDLGISERITDICVRADGRFLIGLHDSFQIRTYSPDGRIIHTYNVEPSDYDFLMALNTSNEILYISWRGYKKGLIQVLDADWQKISIISDFVNPNKPQLRGSEEVEKNEETPAIQGYRDYFDPTDIIFYDNRLHIADYQNRIVILNTDGSLDTIINSPAEGRPPTAYPVRIARRGTLLYIVNWDAQHDRGAINVIDINTNNRTQFTNIDFDDVVNIYFNEYLHFPDIVARNGDILVMDQGNMRIRKFSTDGKFIGYFGEDSLLKTLREIGRIYTLYKIIRWGSIGCALLALITFVLIYKKMKASPSERSLLLTSITTECILGPEGHRRRKLLLIAVPGLGQLAAGRKFRAVLFVVPFLISLLWFFLSLWASLRGVYYSFYYVIYSGSLLLLIWTAIARDAISLNKHGAAPWKFSFERILTILLVPLIPVSIGAAAQILWEINVRQYPWQSLILQRILMEIIFYLKIADEELSAFSVILPANTVIAWSLALGTMFVCIAWQIGSRPFSSLLKGLFGLLTGIISIILLTIFSTAYAGSAFYSPLFLGLFIGGSIFIVFSRDRISPLVILALVAGAGLANSVNLFVTSKLFLSILEILLRQRSLDLSFILGASFRTSHVVVDIYFLSLAASLLLNAIKPRKP